MAWLQRAWRGGEAGVLLADDMGLGKTLQGLAFLDWVRRTGTTVGAPMLIEAPTGLLANWQAEHDRHLSADGLGKPLLLWGAGLRRLRLPSAPATLNLSAIREAGWALTTYETVRDEQQSLAGLGFSVIVFDETQKLKNPASRVNTAAKALNVDFVLSMTGTPVENRLADLWSVVDLVQPGRLGDLKSFSKVYEPPETPPPVLAELKRRLCDDAPGPPPRPPLMLRRMKADRLAALPERRIELCPAPMAPEQADAYEAARSLAKSGGPGAALAALMRLRAVSLAVGSPDELIDPGRCAARSARLTVALTILETIARRREKALLFLEDKDLQPVVKAMLERRFKLPGPLMIINGDTPGPERQKRVETFQDEARQGFDAMILSPKAGGVGLTLTAANHVVHISRWWNPAVEDQCNDRVYRIGQTRPVTVWLPLAIHPASPMTCFDRKLHDLLESKRALSRDLLAPVAATEQDTAEMYKAVTA